MDTVVDAIEIGLHAVSHAADLIPAPAGTIVKLIAGTGIIIVDLLNVCVSIILTRDLTDRLFSGSLRQPRRGFGARAAYWRPSADGRRLS